MKTKSSASVRSLQTRHKKLSAELAALERQTAIAKQEAQATKAVLKAAKGRHREAKHVAKKLKKALRALREEMKVLTARSIRPASKSKTGHARVRKAGTVRLRPDSDSGADNSTVPPLSELGAETSETALPPTNSETPASTLELTA